MAKVDLHVHSRYSERPSMWFLNKIGAKESYTDPFTLYRLMKERGMDFVTITDHNRIDGAELLVERYPGDCFISVEATTYFPEDGCKAHLLVYGITREQFHKIQMLRENIYHLRDYLVEQNLPHSLAHATYAVNGRLTPDHLEKFLLLFNVFEGINGARLGYFNQQWMDILRRLTPEHLAQLEKKHGIHPVGKEPWIKGLTGGSDDHGGIFLGRTYTEAEAETPVEFLRAIQNRQTMPLGYQNDYKGLVYSIYKITYDHLEEMKIASQKSKNLFVSLSQQIFRPRRSTLKEKLFFFMRKKKRSDVLRDILERTLAGLREREQEDIRVKLDFLYDRITEMSDEFFSRLVKSFEKNIRQGDLMGIIKNLSSSLTGVFLAAPFLSSAKHLYSNRALLVELRKRMNLPLPDKPKKILWFTDTINDLNGVSATLKELGWISYKEQMPLKFVTSLLDHEIDEGIPPNTIYLDFFHAFALPFYDHYTLKLPSLLRALERLTAENPDEIYISTPGPLGLLGILVAKLMNLPIASIYHTDFVREAEKIVEDEGILSLLKQYELWFYSMADEVRFQSQEYFHILKERGIPESKLRFLPKGINTSVFRYLPEVRDVFHHSFGIPEGVNLLYAGRISKDKNVDVLLEIYKKLSEKYENINLIFVGDGPYLKDLKHKAKSYERVFFLGKIRRDALPHVYSASDVFVFPSTTDTFGMVVLEAQACGVPALVTDEGGPKQIILPEETGFVLPVSEVEKWVEKIEYLMRKRKTLEWRYLRQKASQHVQKNYRWEVVLGSIFETV
ncbi:glycosyltransferase [Thermospira aquatica]|uniref:Glycosyltransferase n=1 Tax=Thermospira aquatica TaxID=2828656 RepID=A0AAX3B9Z3_9SPIR|nr:glycosyltransferase [Thermospira aquatica]URA09073.1 glycosyltransferase [Thermospira aquatica]